MRKLVVLMMLGAVFAAAGASTVACGDGGAGKQPLTPDTEHNPNLDPAAGGEAGAPAAPPSTPAK